MIEWAILLDFAEKQAKATIHAGTIEYEKNLRSKVGFERLV
jgi:hypothetical protein